MKFTSPWLSLAAAERISKPRYILICLAGVVEAAARLIVEFLLAFFFFPLCFANSITFHMAVRHRFLKVEQYDKRPLICFCGAFFHKQSVIQRCEQSTCFSIVLKTSLNVNPLNTNFRAADCIDEVLSQLSSGIIADVLDLEAVHDPQTGLRLLGGTR